MLWDPRAARPARAEQRARIYDELNRVIAALHSVDHAAVGLGDYGKPGNYIERQIARWTKQYQRRRDRTIDAVDRLIEWLPQHIPPATRPRIVHGDYRLDNVIFHPTEPRILAVLDWELSTLGHPLADFAYHCMTWRMRAARLARPRPALDLAALGIPTEAEYVHDLLRRTGRSAARERRRLELLPRVQHVPPRRHPARHHRTRAAGQRIERAGVGRPAGARARWPSRPGRWRSNPHVESGITMEMKGKVIVVTGGASGIGAALLRRFAQEARPVWWWPT